MFTTKTKYIGTEQIVLIHDGYLGYWEIHKKNHKGDETLFLTKDKSWKYRGEIKNPSEFWFATLEEVYSILEMDFKLEGAL